MKDYIRIPSNMTFKVRGPKRRISKVYKDWCSENLGNHSFNEDVERPTLHASQSDLTLAAIAFPRTKLS